MASFLSAISEYYAKKSLNLEPSKCMKECISCRVLDQTNFNAIQMPDILEIEQNITLWPEDTGLGCTFFLNFKCKAHADTAQESRD